MSIKQQTHPGWCDPRACQPLDDTNTDHRDSPLAWKVAGDDFRVSIGLSRLDEHGALSFTGTVRVNLGLADIESVGPDGNDRQLETDLTAADARMIAAALNCAADRLETVTR